VLLPCGVEVALEHLQIELNVKCDATKCVLLCSLVSTQEKQKQKQKRGAGGQGGEGVEGEHECVGRRGGGRRGRAKRTRVPMKGRTLRE
jgi:hypothetical protein